MREPTRAHACWLSVLLACLSSAAQAQLDLTLLTPSAGQTLGFSLPEPALRPHGAIGAGLFIDYAHDLLDRRQRCLGSVDDVACREQPWSTPQAEVSRLGRGVLVLDVALFDSLELGVTVPVAVTRATPIHVERAQAETRPGLGDVRLSLRGVFGRWSSTSVGWTLDLSLPTATTGTWIGERNATLTPGLALSQRLGRLTLGMHAAYLVRRRSLVLGIEQDDELRLAAAANTKLSDSVALLGELRAHLGIGGRSFDATQAPAELDLGVRLGQPSSLQLDVGVGSAAWPAPRGSGAPVLRALLAARKQFATEACAYGPEDLDNFADADGCADPDNDRDDIPDERDACPNDAEDRDGFNDADGCPEPDNDLDGLADKRDLCPDLSEDSDGFQDQDGCPEPDNDADGVADAADSCRFDAEDRDAYDDEDGCPEPGPTKPTVTVSGSRLLMSDRIYFEDEGDTIRPASAPVLDALVAALKDMARNTRLRVEGHTDDSGNPQYNLDLSYRRARAVVEYLKAQGIAAERLEYVGRGSAVPLGPNRTPEGRALNRRVEFVLLDQ